MSYTVRQWLSASGCLFDDTRKAKTAEDAIEAAIKLAGIYSSVIDDDVRARIRAMEPGDRVRINRPALKLTMIIRRTKR